MEEKLGALNFFGYFTVGLIQSVSKTFVGAGTRPIAKCGEGEAVKTLAMRRTITVFPQGTLIAFTTFLCQ